MTKGLIAIVLINYNGLQDTIECVKSIDENDYRNCKIIIVENGSSDFERIKDNNYLSDHASIITLPDNVGFSGANNIAIEYALNNYNPEFFLFLNNDTIIEKDALSRLYTASKNLDNCGIITGRILYYSNKDIIWAAGGKFDWRTGIADQPQLGKKSIDEIQVVEETGFISGCCMLIPTHILKKVGTWDDRFFLYAEDTDLCCRVVLAGYKLYYVNASKIYHKVSMSTGKNSSLSQYYNTRNNLFIIKRYAKYPVFGYLKFFYRSLRKYFKGNLDSKIFFRAVKDFRKMQLGKLQ